MPVLVVSSSDSSSDGSYSDGDLSSGGEPSTPPLDLLPPPPPQDEADPYLGGLPPPPVVAHMDDLALPPPPVAARPQPPVPGDGPKNAGPKPPGPKPKMKIPVGPPASASPKPAPKVPPKVAPVLAPRAVVPVVPVVPAVPVVHVVHPVAAAQPLKVTPLPQAVAAAKVVHTPVPVSASRSSSNVTSSDSSGKKKKVATGDATLDSMLDDMDAILNSLSADLNIDFDDDDFQIGNQKSARGKYGLSAATGGRELEEFTVLPAAVAAQAPKPRAPTKPQRSDSKGSDSSGGTGLGIKVPAAQPTTAARSASGAAVISSANASPVAPKRSGSVPSVGVAIGPPVVLPPIPAASGKQEAKSSGGNTPPPELPDDPSEPEYKAYMIAKYEWDTAHPKLAEAMKSTSRANSQSRMVFKIYLEAPESKEGATQVVTSESGETPVKDYREKVCSRVGVDPKDDAWQLYIGSVHMEGDKQLREYRLNPKGEQLWLLSSKPPTVSSSLLKEYEVTKPMPEKIDKNVRAILKSVKLSQAEATDKKNRALIFNILRESYEHSMAHKPRKPGTPSKTAIFTPTEEVPYAILSDLKKRTQDHPKLKSYQLETYLSKDDFERIFKCTKEEWLGYSAAKKWNIKRQAKLAF